MTGAALLAFAGSWPSRATADAPSGSYTALARADAFRVEVTAAGFVVNELTDTSGPSAQAKLDSLGDSEGFAALPYPGDTVTTAPGLVASLLAPQLGLPPPSLPPYPLVARSQYPGQPDGTVNQGPLRLTAHSGLQTSSGRAIGAGADSGGNSVGSLMATSTVTIDDAAKVVSDATSTVEGLSVAGVLRIGAMSASAHVVQDSGHSPTTSSAFKVEGVTVAGVAVGVDDGGLVLPGTHQPLPPSSSLAQVLKATGVQVTYLAPVAGGGMVQSGGLSITVPQQTPAGTVTVTYTFGLARAGLSGQPTPAVSGGAGAAGGGAASPSSGGSLGGSAAGTTLGAAAAPASPGPSEAVAPRVATGTSPRARVGSAAGRVPISTTSSMSVYLVLVIGGVMALSGSLAFRVFGVRLAWTS